MFLLALLGNRWGLKPLGTNGLRCFASYGLSGVDVLAGFVWQPLGAEALGDQRATLLCQIGRCFQNASIVWLVSVV